MQETISRRAAVKPVIWTDYEPMLLKMQQKTDAEPKAQKLVESLA